MYTTLKNKYDALINEVSDYFSHLRNQSEEIVLLNDEDIDDCTDYLELRNNNGDIIDVVAIKVNKQGIKVANAEDIEKQYYIGLFDLAEIQDILDLIVNMEDVVKKINL